MVPLAVGCILRSVNSDLCSLVSGGKREFFSLVFYGERDGIVLPIGPAIVQKRSKVFNGYKFKLYIEFKPLSWESREGKAPLLKLLASN